MALDTSSKTYSEEYFRTYTCSKSQSYFLEQRKSWETWRDRLVTRIDQNTPDNQISAVAEGSKVFVRALSGLAICGIEWIKSTRCLIGCAIQLSTNFYKKEYSIQFEGKQIATHFLGMITLGLWTESFENQKKELDEGVLSKNKALPERKSFDSTVTINDPNYQKIKNKIHELEESRQQELTFIQLSKFEKNLIKQMERLDPTLKQPPLKFSAVATILDELQQELSQKQLDEASLTKQSTHLFDPSIWKEGIASLNETNELSSATEETFQKLLNVYNNALYCLFELSERRDPEK